MVIYKAEYGNNITFVRPVDEWLEIVEKTQASVAIYPDIIMI